MSKEDLKVLEEEISRLKQKLEDYLKIAEMFDEDKGDIEIQTNIMLEDLSKLLKRKEKLSNKK